MRSFGRAREKQARNPDFYSVSGFSGGGTRLAMPDHYSACLRLADPALFSWQVNPFRCVYAGSAADRNAWHLRLCRRAELVVRPLAGGVPGWRHPPPTMVSLSRLASAMLRCGLLARFLSVTARGRDEP